MIDLKAAVEAAKQSFETLFEGREYQNLALEEVEMDDKGNHWFITLGYNVPEAQDYRPNPLALMATMPRSVRHYKVFKIGSTNGTVVSMKIRNPWAEVSKS